MFQGLLGIPDRKGGSSDTHRFRTMGTSRMSPSRNPPSKTHTQIGALDPRGTSIISSWTTRSRPRGTPPEVRGRAPLLVPGSRRRTEDGDAAPRGRGGDALEVRRCVGRKRRAPFGGPRERLGEERLPASRHDEPEYPRLG